MVAIPFMHSISLLSFRPLLAGLVLGTGAALAAAEPAASAPAPSSPTAGAPAAPIDQHTLDKRTSGVLKRLQLSDAAQKEAVLQILEQHFRALYDWHQQHDPELAGLWKRWADARTQDAKDETKAAAVVAEIRATYASLQPQHQSFLQALAKHLTPEQVEAVKDAMTSSPGMRRTYEAYLKMIPTFTDEEKAFIAGKLLVAREMAMDAVSDKEKANLFKTQKVQVEAYIDAQGYDYRAAYKAFANNQPAPKDAITKRVRTAPAAP